MVLTPKRVRLAYGIGVITDVLQFLLGPLGWAFADGAQSPTDPLTRRQAELKSKTSQKGRKNRQIAHMSSIRGKVCYIFRSLVPSNDDRTTAKHGSLA